MERDAATVAFIIRPRNQRAIDTAGLQRSCGMLSVRFLNENNADVTVVL